jgi:hypothetical protein
MLEGMPGQAMERLQLNGLARDPERSPFPRLRRRSGDGTVSAYEIRSRRLRCGLVHMTSRAKNAGFEKEQMQLLDDIERKQDFDPNEAPTRISSKIPRDVIGIGINRPSLCC